MNDCKINDIFGIRAAIKKMRIKSEIFFFVENYYVKFFACIPSLASKILKLTMTLTSIFRIEIAVDSHQTTTLNRRTMNFMQYIRVPLSLE